MKRSRFLCTWNNLLVGWKVDSLVLGSFVHKNLIHALFSGYSFLMLAPTVYQLIGNKKFVFLFFTVAISSNLASMISRKLKSSFYETKVIGLSAVIVSLRSILLYASVGWNDSVIMGLGKIILSHCIVEYLIIGNSVDYEGIICGLLTGLVMFKCI